MYEQTIWLAPRAKSFAETCEACAEEDASSPTATNSELRGSLERHRPRDWASCANGHRVRVLRITAAMPAGAFR